MKVRRKLYTDKGETAYEINYWQDIAHDQQINIVVELQKADIGSGNMWCKIEGEFVDSYESCGEKNYCKNYNPCNGKNGRCRELINGLISTGKKFTVFPNGKVEKYNEK